MRVIAGEFRHRKLKALPGTATRPTYDRLKETLFNVLSAASGPNPAVAADPSGIAGATFVDLFAGTGSIGIEALSRGAAQVYFVESDRKAMAIIHENLSALNITSGVETLLKPAGKALRALAARGVRCKYCFLDPPYKMEGAYQGILQAIASAELLTEDGIVIAEHDKRFDPGEGAGRLKRYRRLEQGDSALSFYALEKREK